MQEVKSYSKTLSFLPRKITLSLNNTATSTRRIFIASISKTIKNKETNDQVVAPTEVIEQQQQQHQEEVFPAFAIARKKVSFSPMVKVMEMDASYYTPEEKEATFYNSDDYQDFKHDVKSTLQMINARMTIDEINFTRKGIESYMPNGEELRKTWRTKGRRAVFNTQRRLYFDDGEVEKETESNNNTNNTTTNNNRRGRCCFVGGEEDDFSEAIAAAYAPTGIKSVQLAYVTGLMDERMVKMADLTAASSEEEENNNNNNVNKELNSTTSIGCSKRTEILLFQQSCQQQRLHQLRRHRQRRRQLLHSGVIISPTAA